MAIIIRIRIISAPPVTTHRLNITLNIRRNSLVRGSGFSAVVIEFTASDINHHSLVSYSRIQPSVRNIYQKIGQAYDTAHQQDTCLHYQEILIKSTDN